MRVALPVSVDRVELIFHDDPAVDHFQEPAGLRGVHLPGHPGLDCVVRETMRCRFWGQGCGRLPSRARPPIMTVRVKNFDTFAHKPGPAVKYSDARRPRAGLAREKAFSRQGLAALARSVL